jgi:hypothetical protein
MRRYLDLLNENAGMPKYDQYETEKAADNFSGLLSRFLDQNTNLKIARQRGLDHIYWTFKRGDPFGEKYSKDPTVTFEIPYWQEKDAQEIIRYYKQEILSLKQKNNDNYVTQILGMTDLTDASGRPISMPIKDPRTGEVVSQPVKGLTFSFRLYYRSDKPDQR